MRIGIDARPIQGRFTGDCTYWRGLIEGLSRLDTDDEYFLYLDARLPKPKIPESKAFRVRFLRALNWRIWSILAFPKALREDRIQVAHVQYTIPPAMPCRTITTIHDVSFKRHPEFFKLKDRFILDMGVERAAKHAARILAVSEYTRKELLALYNISPAKVTLVYSGVDKQFKPMDRVIAADFVGETYGVHAPFVLTVGVIQPRKNLPKLLEAFASLKKIWQSEHVLVVVGKRGWLETSLERRIEQLGLTGDVILTGYVPHEHLPSLYNAADAFVYPSVYEGFGLPPLEAMACGTPIITGNFSSLPEVVGEAGIMVDPHDADAFADAMMNVLSSRSLQGEMYSQGIEQAKKFSWDEMARQVSVIYREVGR